MKCFIASMPNTGEDCPESSDGCGWWNGGCCHAEGSEK